MDDVLREQLLALLRTDREILAILEQAYWLGFQAAQTDQQLMEALS